jgi:hypothetical protein
MTSFGLESVAYQSPDRRWLADDHGTEVAPGVPLDLTLFNAGQHYANGWIADGCVLGKVTATGKYGPYLDAAVDGRQTAVGIMLNPVSVFQSGTATLRTNMAVPILIHGFVNVAFLPFTVGNAATGGYIDAAGQVDLKNIIFLASGLQA